MDWNQRYIDKDTPWDHGEAAPPLAEYLEQHEFKGRILVPGCGRGHDVRLLAQKGADVTGFDIATTAVEEAKSFPQVNNETYQVADLFKLPESFNGSFDGVFEHTCFCTLGDELRADYVDKICEVIKPGGHFLGIFFTDIEDEEPGKPPRSILPEEIDILFNSKFKLLDIFHPETRFESRFDCKEELRLMQKI